MREEIRELLRASPFRPFTIIAASGQKYRVPHPDFCHVTPSGEVWVWFLEKKVEKCARLSTLLISEIVTERRVSA